MEISLLGVAIAGATVIGMGLWLYNQYLKGQHHNKHSVN